MNLMIRVSESGLNVTRTEIGIVLADEVVSRESLLNHVWGYDSTAFTRTVDTHMARRRQKIGAVPAEGRHFVML